MHQINQIQYPQWAQSGYEYSVQHCLTRFAGRTINTRVSSTAKMNARVAAAKYAVQGAIPMCAAEHQKAIAGGAKLPFDRLLWCNIGNPQVWPLSLQTHIQFGWVRVELTCLRQKCFLNFPHVQMQAVGMTPLTFYRQVIACSALAQSPGSGGLNLSSFPSDIASRVKVYNQGMKLGAYTDSTGSEVVRKQVANFLARRDGVEADPASIMMFNGASDAVSLILQVTALKNTCNASIERTHACDQSYILALLTIIQPAPSSEPIACY